MEGVCFVEESKHPPIVDERRFLYLLQKRCGLKDDVPLYRQVLNVVPVVLECSLNPLFYI